jgi:hypothetical protein
LPFSGRREREHEASGGSGKQICFRGLRLGRRGRITRKQCRQGLRNGRGTSSGANYATEKNDDETGANDCISRALKRRERKSMGIYDKLDGKILN